MICPCCYDALRGEDEVPRQVARVRPGDLYCERCQWLFARELIKAEGPVALSAVWHCPIHKTLNPRRELPLSPPQG
jgi:hypothetical protein